MSNTSAIVKPALVLLLITVISGGALGAVNKVTEVPIAQKAEEKKAESMKKVLSDAVSFGEEQKIEDEKVSTPGLDILTVTPAKDSKGKNYGYAVTVETKGFSAGLQLMFGVDKEGTITGLSVLDCSNETPGLGANSGEESYTVNGAPWYAQFTGKDESVALTKDGGEVEAITGATITSRAVTSAAKEAVKYIEENEGGLDK